MELEDFTSMIMNMEPDPNVDPYFFDRDTLYFITKWMLKDPDTRHVHMEMLLHELKHLYCLQEDYLRSFWKGTSLEAYLTDALSIADKALLASRASLLIIPRCVEGIVEFVGHDLRTMESFSIVPPAGRSTLGQPQLVAIGQELFWLDVDQAKGGFVVQKLWRKHWNRLGVYGMVNQPLLPKHYHEDYQYDYCHGQKPVTITGFLAPTYVPLAPSSSGFTGMEISVVRMSNIQVENRTDEDARGVEAMHFVEGLSLDLRKDR